MKPEELVWSSRCLRAGHRLCSPCPSLLLADTLCSDSLLHCNSTDVTLPLVVSLVLMSSHMLCHKRITSRELAEQSALLHDHQARKGEIEDIGMTSQPEAVTSKQKGTFNAHLLILNRRRMARSLHLLALFQFFMTWFQNELAFWKSACALTDLNGLCSATRTTNMTCAMPKRRLDSKKSTESSGNPLLHRSQECKEPYMRSLAANPPNGTIDNNHFLIWRRRGDLL